MSRQKVYYNYNNIIVHPIDECMHVFYIVCIRSQCTMGKIQLTVYLIIYYRCMSYRDRWIERTPALYMCDSSIDQSE